MGVGRLISRRRLERFLQASPIVRRSHRLKSALHACWVWDAGFFVELENLAKSLKLRWSKGLRAVIVLEKVGFGGKLGGVSVSSWEMLAKSSESGYAVGVSGTAVLYL